MLSNKPAKTVKEYQLKPLKISTTFPISSPAIYDDAWGKKLWKEPLTEDEKSRSLVELYFVKNLATPFKMI